MLNHLRGSLLRVSKFLIVALSGLSFSQVVNAEEVVGSIPGQFSVSPSSKLVSGFNYLLISVFLSIGLAGCGGDSSSGGSSNQAPTGPALEVAYAEKTLLFSWSEHPGATHYKFYENKDGASGFTQLGDDIQAITRSFSNDISVHLQEWSNALYMVEACDDSGCEASNVLVANAEILKTIGQLIASNAGPVHEFGTAVAISGDGNYIAIGAPREGSSATGVDGDQSDNSAAESGAVYVFNKSGKLWVQQAYIKSSNTGTGDFFGNALSINDDGTTLAIGAYKEDSAATGINGDENDNLAIDSGAVYVYIRNVSTWSKQAYIKASNTEDPSISYTEIVDRFGTALDLNGDGDILVVGSPYEDGAGNNGDDAHQCARNINCQVNSGAVYVFTRAGTVWSQTAYLKASNREDRDNFGTTVALDSIGDTLIVGSPYEDSGSTGVNSLQNNQSSLAGAAYVFQFVNGQWSQQAYLKASNTGAVDYFGLAVAVSGDGLTVAVGATREASSAVGINGDQNDDSIILAGAVYVYTFSVGSWSQQVYLKASNTDDNHHFGAELALSFDGSVLAVGAPGDDSLATGINGNQADNSRPAVGAVYTFIKSSTTWSQRAYVKSRNPVVNNIFGHSLSLNSDGSILLVGEKTDIVSGFPADQGSVYIY